MNITVTGKSDAATEAVMDYAREKAQKLSRYFDRLLAIDVVLDTNRAMHEVEMITSGGGHRFVGKESADEMTAAIDLVIDKMETQLSRYKERLQDRNRKKSTVQDIEEFEEVEESYQDVIDS